MATGMDRPAGRDGDPDVVSNGLADEDKLIVVSYEGAQNPMNSHY